MPLIWSCACRFKNDTLIKDTECGYHAAMRKRCGEAEGEAKWLEQYKKGISDGIESAAIVCEKSYSYDAAHDVARKIRSLDRPK